MKRRRFHARRGRVLRISSTAGAATAAMLAFTPRSAQGATVSWTNAAGGNWGSAANWVAGPTGSTPPATTDNAAFNILNGYTVSLDVNPSISGVGIGGSNVTFAGSLGDTLTNTGGLTVTSGSLNLTSGSNVNFTNIGTISLSANASVSSGNDLSGPGLTVTNGATATFTG